MRLVLRTSPEPLNAAADKRALRQILVNLLSNAVKFTPRTAASRFHGAHADQMIAVRVADNGVGIGPKT